VATIKVRSIRGRGWGFLALLVAAGCGSSKNAPTGADAGAAGHVEPSGAGAPSAGAGGDSQEPSAGASAGGTSGAGGEGGSAVGGAGGTVDPCSDGDGVYEGSLEVKGDLAALECLTVVHGDLVIRLGADAPASVENLLLVTGTLSLRNEDDGSGQPLRFELSALSQAGALSIRGLSGVETLAFPALDAVGGDVEFGSNEALAAVDATTLPVLERIHGDLLIGPCRVGGNAPSQTFTCRDNPSLESVELPALTELRDLIVGESTALRTVSAPRLELGRNVQAAQCLPLHNELLDRYGDDYCSTATTLSELSLPMLRSAEAVELMELAQLTHVDLAALESCASITISSEADENVIALELSSLTELDHLYSSEVVETALPLLQTATSLDLPVRGDLNLPELFSVVFLHLQATTALDFDCSVKLPALGSSYPTLALTGEFEAVTCASVTTIDALRVLYGPATSIAFPSLGSAGELSFSGLDELAALDFPVLRAADTISLGSLAALPGIEFPALEEVDVSFDAINVGSTALRAPLLERVDATLMVANAPALTELALPALEEVGGTFILSNVDALTALAVPALVSAGGLRIADNATFSSVDAPALTTLGELNAENNVSWLECNIETLADDFGIECECSGNATCAE
jgi:hypothetical protein